MDTRKLLTVSLLFILTAHAALPAQNLNWSQWAPVVDHQTGQPTRLQWRFAYRDSPDPVWRGGTTDYARSFLAEIRSTDVAQAGSCASLNFMDGAGNVLYEAVFFPRQITSFDIHQSEFGGWRSRGVPKAARAIRLTWEPMTRELKLKGMNTQIDYLSGIGDWHGCTALLDQMRPLMTTGAEVLDWQSLYTSTYLAAGDYAAAVKSYKAQMRMDTARASTDGAMLAAICLMGNQLDSAKAAVCVDGLPDYQTMNRALERVDGLMRIYEVDVPQRHPFRAWVAAESPAALERARQRR